MPLGIQLAAARRNDGCDFVDAVALITTMQFTCNPRSEVSEEVGHGNETAANDS